MTYTDPQAAAVGADAGRFSAMVPVSGVAKTATYTRAYAESNGFLTLLSDGERLTGAYALGPEAGEWLQQATLAIRAHVPLDVLTDTIQPFPTFSEIYVEALKALRAEIAAAHEAGPARDRRWRTDEGGPMTTETAAPSTAREPELRGQTVVVIGGSAGIGLETARRARAEGADVVLTGRSPERLKDAAADARRPEHRGVRRRATRPPSRPSSPGSTGPIDHVHGHGRAARTTRRSPRWTSTRAAARSSSTRC